MKQVEERIIVVRVPLGYVAYMPSVPDQVYYGRSLHEAYGRLVFDALQRRYLLPIVTDQDGLRDGIYSIAPLDDEELKTINEYLIARGYQPVGLA